jgi:hypothetical protein
MPRKPVRKPWSGTRPAALGFVIVCGIEIDSAEGFQNAKLLAMLNVLRERGGDGFFLGLVAAGAAGFLDQTVVQS